MAKALFNHLAHELGVNARADSAGTAPGPHVNPLATEAMERVGIPIGDAVPKLLTLEMARSADHLITMGCGVDSDACPAGTYFSEDWGLDDPAGQPLDRVMEIRDEIRRRVEALVESFR